MRPAVGARTLVLIAAALVIAAARPASGQTAEELFDPQTIHEVRLYLNSRDLRQLREHYDENAYFTADLAWKNVRVRNIGVRSRGVASRSAVKLGLRIDFNRFTTGQRFAGLTSLILDNLWTDPSMMREQLAMAVFRRMGQPAPRESFARLYINNEDQGLYALVEPVDTAFLARTQGDGDGYLFEYRWLRPYFGEYLGGDLASYRELFEPETHRLEADVQLYAPIHDLFREVNAPGPLWRESVERYLDLAQLASYVAVETFLSERDGLAGHAGMANFYLYRPAGSTRHRVLTWDRDSAFERIDQPIFERLDLYAVLQRALTFPDLRSTYLDVLESCARSAAGDGWLAAEVDRLAALITPAVHADPLKPFTNEAYDADVAFLREFASGRAPFVMLQVASARTEHGRVRIR
jgi:spore coat protein H